MLISLNLIRSEKNYDEFINCGIDDETANFYSKERLKPIFGRDEFIQGLQDLDKGDLEIAALSRLRVLVSIEQVLKVVSEHFNVTQSLIKRGCQGHKFPPRAIAIYLCRKLTLAGLKEIAIVFNLGHYASVSSTVRSVIAHLEFQSEIEVICKKLLQC